MADEDIKTPGPRARQEVRKKKKEKINRFPGDFQNFIESKERKDSKKTAKDKYEKDKQHPVKGKHAGFDRLVNAQPEDMKAFKKYRKNTAETRDKNKLKTGGRAGYKGGKSVKKKGGAAIKGSSPILR